MKTKTLIQRHRQAIRTPFAIIKCERRSDKSGRIIGRWFVYFDQYNIGLEGRTIDGEIRFKGGKRHDFDSKEDMYEWWDEVCDLPDEAEEPLPDEEHDNRFGDFAGVYGSEDEFAECTNYGDN